MLYHVRTKPQRGSCLLGFKCVAVVEFTRDCATCAFIYFYQSVLRETESDRKVYSVECTQWSGI